MLLTNRIQRQHASSGGGEKANRGFREPLFVIRPRSHATVPGLYTPTASCPRVSGSPDCARFIDAAAGCTSRGCTRPRRAHSLPWPGRRAAFHNAAPFRQSPEDHGARQPCTGHPGMHRARPRDRRLRRRGGAPAAIGSSEQRGNGYLNHILPIAREMRGVPRLIGLPRMPRETLGGVIHAHQDRVHRPD